MPITKRIQYRYDSVRNKVGMTDADGGLHTYTYDLDRRLMGVINPLGERTTYAYDPASRRTSVQLANGTRTSYVYDVCSRVKSVHTLKSDDSTVSKFEYEYDGNGRRTSVLEADGSRVTWTYDSISQVTAEWRTGTNPHRHTFTYDSVGNRTLKIEDGARTTLVYDACNQLLTSEDTGGTTTFTYDGNGNQTVVQKPNGDRTTQVWDYENRLVKTIQPSGGVTSMAYDADGLRLKLEEPTGTKLFVWDDQNYLAETDAAGTTQAAFTTEPSTYGSLISHRKAGASTTYHFDALGSTRALTDASEAVLEQYNYTAFGTLLGSPTLLTPFLWGGMVGYYWDAALATQYIRARHYQPAIARWISLDPIGFAGGDANLFRYVGNSPTSGSTERRLRLRVSAYGNVPFWVAPVTLYYFKFAHMQSGRNGISLDPSGMITKIFSRPTDDSGEVVNGVPYETATITVTVKANVSNCKCAWGMGVYYGVCLLSSVCRGTIAIDFSYSSTLKSSNGDNPATAAAPYGIEVDNTGYLWDSFYPFTVTPPPGDGIVGTVVSGTAQSSKSCNSYKNCSTLINQKYYIRAEHGAGPIYGAYEGIDQSFDYSITINCLSGTFSETLSGKMENPTANGPLREIPPEQPYPPSPHPGP